MKKILALILVLIMLVSLSAACNQTKKEPGEDKGEDNRPADVKTVTLTPWAGAAEAYAKMEEAFAKGHDDVKLVITEQSSYHEWLSAQASADNLPDIFYLTNYTLVWNYAKAGYLMDLTGKPYTKGLFESTLYGASYNDKLYALPWALSTANAVIYNVDHFKEAGIEKVPTTLTELEDACTKLKNAGYTPFAGALLDGWTVGQAYMPLISAQFDDPFKLTEDLDAGTKTFTKDVDVASITRFLDMLKSNSQSNALDTGDGGAVKLFAEGEASMYVNGDWTFSGIIKINPDINYDIFALPADDNPEHTKLSMDTGFILGVNAKTPNPDAVDVVLNWITDGKDTSDKACGPIFTKYLGIPAFESVNQPEYGIASKTITDYLTNNKTTPWFFSLAPQGFKQVSESEAVGYLNGTYTAEEFWTIMDEEWVDLAK